MHEHLLQRARDIRLAIFDVDGVLTDGRLYFLTDGSEFKTFNTLDGHGIKLLRRAGKTAALDQQHEEREIGEGIHGGRLLVMHS